jgi:sugar lactone lactonase YvrE
LAPDEGSVGTFNYPSGVATDGDGNVYIADTENSRIRMVDPNGYITTVAGNGEYGFGGDGGQATQAKLSWPRDVRIDVAGNIYFADPDNNRIRKVDRSSGVITTVAGNGEYGFGGDGGLATQASLAAPFGVALDGDKNLYISDTDNNVVRKVDLASGIITRFAGNGIPLFTGDRGLATEASLYAPLSVAVDSESLYIADANNHRIRRVNLRSKIIDTFAGNGLLGNQGDGGPATLASFDSAWNVAPDRAGNVFISDNGNHRVRKVDPFGVINNFAGNGENGFSGDGGPAKHARLSYPQGVVVDGAGNLYIGDMANHRIRKVNSFGVISTFAGRSTLPGSGDEGQAKQAKFAGPLGITVDDTGNLYIADSGDDSKLSWCPTLRRYNVCGPEPFAAINSYDTNTIRKVDRSGVITAVAGKGRSGFAGDEGKASQASLYSPRGIAISAHDLYIADAGNSRVRKVDLISGLITTVAGTGIASFAGDGGDATNAGLNSPRGVAVGDNTLYIADTGNNRVRKVDMRTGFIDTIAGNGLPFFTGDDGPANLASLNAPEGVAVLGTNLYIADTGNHRIRRVDLRSGVIATVAGSGTHESFIPVRGDVCISETATGLPQNADTCDLGDSGPAIEASLRSPLGIALGEENLYIADSGHNRVRKVDLVTGVIDTVAGNGLPLFSGDGGPSPKAGLSLPTGVALDAHGNLFIAEFGSAVIRVVVSAASKPPTQPQANGASHRHARSTIATRVLSTRRAWEEERLFPAQAGAALGLPPSTQPRSQVPVDLAAALLVIASMGNLARSIIMRRRHNAHVG